MATTIQVNDAAMNGLQKTVLAALLIVSASMAATAHAQIAFRAASSGALAAATITLRGAGAAAEVNPAATGACAGTQFITPAIPAGSNGDLLVAVVHNRDGATLTPSGAAWNTLHSDDQANHRTRVYWRLATGADTLTVTKTGTCTVNGVMIGQVARYNGVDITQPFESTVRFGFQNTAAVVNHAGGTTNATVANSLSLFAALVSDDNTVNAPTPATFTAAFNSQTSTGTDATIALFHKLETTSGNKGPYAATMSATDPSTGLFAIVRPALGLAMPVPAGTVVGDVMIASIAVRPCSNAGLPCTVSATAHADWTLVSSQLQPAGGGTGGNGNQLFVYRRVVTGTEPAAYTWTFGGTPVVAGASGGVLSFSGVDTASPIVAQAGALTVSASSHTAPQIDTGAVANTMLVSTHASNSSTTWTVPGGMIERVDTSSVVAPDDLGIAVEINTELRAAAGLTGTRTAVYTTPGTPANDTGATHMLALRPGTPVHHYAIGVLSTSVANCDLAEVTITAHNAAHAAVNPPAGRIVTLSVSSGAATAVWQPTPVSGTGGWTPAAGTATYVWPGSESTFTVRLRQSAVISLTVNTNDTFVTEAVAEDPTINFVNSAFRISNGANAALSVGTQIASKPSNTGVGAQSLFLQAIRTDTVTGACTSLFPNGAEVDITVGAQCNNPAACTQNVTLTTTSITGSPTGSFVPAGAGIYPSTIRFRFDTANAEAPFFFTYADAGLTTLQFRHITSVPAVTIAGTSNAFVTRPFGFAFRGANAATPVQHGTLPSSALLAAAGDNFTMTLAAYRWAAVEDDGTGNPLPGANIADNGLTPNFASTTTVDVSPTGGNLPGVVPGVVSRGPTCVSAANIAAGSFAGGSATVNDWCYSEAGNAFLRATSNDYISAGVNITGNSGLDGTGVAGGYIGRFRPKSFALSGVQTRTNRVAAACTPVSTFTYMDEGLGLAFSLEARNTQGAITQNYNGVYAKLGIGTFTNFSFGARSGSTDLIARVDSTVNPTGGWLNGVAAVTATTGIRRAASPDGPYPAVQFGIAPVDSDGVAMNILNFDADGNSVNERANLNVTTEVRFGRLFLGNAFGSALLDLPIPIRTEYFSSGFFATNTLDGCTTVPASAITFTFTGTNLVACETQSNPSGVISFASGQGSLRLARPGAGNDGSVDLRVNLGATPADNTCTSAVSTLATTANLPWLQGNWGSGGYADNPGARATFGLFKNADEFIYLRENY